MEAEGGGGGGVEAQETDKIRSGLVPTHALVNAQRRHALQCAQCPTPVLTVLTAGHPLHPALVRDPRSFHAPFYMARCVILLVMNAAAIPPPSN